MNQYEQEIELYFELKGTPDSSNCSALSTFLFTLIKHYWYYITKGL